jgi:predicted N-formylglutamate amidohydrolase
VSPRRRPPAGILVTCEHGGNRVPIAYQDLFRRAGPALASHRGWDAGTLPLARDLARATTGVLRVATVSRLLVDLNRSPHNRLVFSEWTRRLPASDRRTLLERYHAPHREAVAADVAALGARSRTVIHLAVHSFTPVLEGRVRRADVALLYDPARPAERALAEAWTRSLKRRLPDLAVRRNQPYRGASDGLTTWLRRGHEDGRYLGIEIEVNQRLLDVGGRFPRDVAHALTDGLSDALAAR